MHLSELQNKNIVNMIDGKNVGNIIDVLIDDKNGKITSLIIEPNKHAFSFLGRSDEIKIKWSNITKIGEDVILVDLSL